ncbi:MAG: nucleoside triphosphate pyrophosphohydrolase [Francisellaceae bacterium]
MHFEVVDRQRPYTLEDLLEIMHIMRGCHGCAWTQAQTFGSLTPHIIEEAYELVDAIESGDKMQIKAELADILNQIVFYASIAEEKQYFNFAEIIDYLAEKLIRRHPDVFADGEVMDYQELEVQWQQIKKKERRQKNQNDDSILADIAKTMPAVSIANKLQTRAASVNFDWSRIDDVMAQLRNEIVEFEEALVRNDREHAVEELGDLMFCCVNLSRHLKADPEQVLRAANHKFERRFRLMEKIAKLEGKKLEHCSDDEFQSLWNQAKLWSQQSTR